MNEDNVNNEQNEEKKERLIRPVQLFKTKILMVVICCGLLVVGQIETAFKSQLWYQIILWTSVVIFAIIMALGYYLKYKKPPESIEENGNE